MLKPDSWRALAADLGLGRSKRVDHDCGTGRTLKISRDSKGYNAYCWRCSDNGFLPGPRESLAEKLERLHEAAKGEAALNGASLPEPRLYAVVEWPIEAKLWFYRAGLSNADIGTIGAYYHAPSRRVVLPVRQGINVVYWQARSLRSDQLPKYMAADTDRAKVIPTYGLSASITLTEDLLSAYKVGRVAEAWCLLGTSLSPHLLALLMQAGKPVNVWLDNDLPPKHLVNRGQIAALKVAKQLRAAGLVVRNIVAPKDPKLMTFEQIKELLNGPPI